MIAALAALALAASSPQERLEALIQYKVSIALECPGTGRESYAAFCHPGRVSGTDDEAARALHLMLSVDEDGVLCTAGYGQACLRQTDTVRSLGTMGWCHAVSLSKSYSTNVLWARCSAVRAARERAAREQPSPPPSPSDYCKGFSASECVEIQRTVNAPSEPAYCAPGFGLPERGLNPVQLRSCSVIASKR